MTRSRVASPSGAPDVKLLAFDLDGTALGAGGDPVPGLAAALQELDAHGVFLVVCTGRPLHTAVRLVMPLGVNPRALVCYHGSLVVDARSGAWLRHLTLPGDAARGLTDDALALGLTVTQYVGDERREVPASRPVGATDAAPTRIVVTGDEARLAAALPELLRTWGDGLRIEHGAPGVIDVLAAGADKGAALKVVARHLGVPLENVAACGDSASDVSLLRVAGLAIAVGDAAEGLRRYADAIVPQALLPDLLLSLARRT